MTRTRTMVWSVAGIVAFFLLMFCGGAVAFMGIFFMMGAPHAFGQDVMGGSIWLLAGFTLMFVAIWLLRSSVRRLESLRQVRRPN